MWSYNGGSAQPLVLSLLMAGLNIYRGCRLFVAILSSFLRNFGRVWVDMDSIIIRQ